MDLRKFEDLLEKQALFFARADKLGDSFEGAYSRANLTKRDQVYAGTSLPEATHEKIGRFNAWVRQWTFVSCWRAGERESDTMWRAYCRSDEAVAISTTAGALTRLVPRTRDRNWMLRHVRYSDYETDFIPEDNYFWPFVNKRLEYSHEQEVRILYSAPPRSGDSFDFGAQSPTRGDYVSLDVGALIQEVVLRPGAKDSFERSIQTLLRQYDVSADVRRSNLDELPVFLGARLPLKS